MLWSLFDQSNRKSTRTQARAFPSEAPESFIHSFIHSETLCVGCAHGMCGDLGTGAFTHEPWSWPHHLLSLPHMCTLPQYPHLSSAKYADLGESDSEDSGLCGPRLISTSYCFSSLPLSSTSHLLNDCDLFAVPGGKVRTGEMAQQLRPITAVAEGLGLAPSIHMGILVPRDLSF